MNNVTKPNYEGSDFQDIIERGMIYCVLPLSPKPDVESINIRDCSSHLRRKYDLPKFLRSLTDEEVTWRKTRKNKKIFYAPSIVGSPETDAKLEDAIFQMKKYQVEGVFDKEVSILPFYWCVEAKGPENALRMFVREHYNDQNNLSNLEIIDVREVA